MPEGAAYVGVDSISRKNVNRKQQSRQPGEYEQQQADPELIGDLVALPAITVASVVFAAHKH